MKDIKITFITALCAVLFVLSWVTSPAAAQDKKPDAPLTLSKGQVAVGIGGSSY